MIMFVLKYVLSILHIEKNHLKNAIWENWIAVESKAEITKKRASLEIVDECCNICKYFKLIIKDNWCSK